MYKVIIVDDEKQIVDGLCKMIKWPELGFIVCDGGERHGSNTSYQVAQARPCYDRCAHAGHGWLKMLEHVRGNISEDMEFIILSGFSEFQYAQKAMQYNVKSYILKPIDEAQIYGILVDIKAYWKKGNKKKPEDKSLYK